MIEQNSNEPDYSYLWFKFCFIVSCRGNSLLLYDFQMYDNIPDTSLIHHNLIRIIQNNLNNKQLLRLYHKLDTQELEKTISKPNNRLLYDMYVCLFKKIEVSNDSELFNRYNKINLDYSRYIFFLY